VRWFWISIGILKKKTCDLVKFTSMPEASHKRSMIDLKHRDSLAVDIPIRSILSMNFL
jgi:hypothetical protein